MSTDLSQQIRELMERGLRPVAITDIEARAPVQVSALRKAAARFGLRRGLLILAGAAGVAAGVAVAVAVLLAGSSGSNGGSTGPALLAAWAVQRSSDGTVKVTIRELRDPAGLQRSLRANGVPANVVFLRHYFEPTTSATAIPRSCRAPRMSNRANAILQGKIMPFPPISPTGVVLLIRPTAIPHGIGLFIKAWAASPGTQSGPGLSLQTDLVLASPQCTG